MTNISDLFPQICQIEVFVITNPRYKKPISQSLDTSSDQGSTVRTSYDLLRGLVFLIEYYVFFSAPEQTWLMFLQLADNAASPSLFITLSHLLHKRWGSTRDNFIKSILKSFVILAIWLARWCDVFTNHTMLCSKSHLITRLWDNFT